MKFKASILEQGKILNNMCDVMRPHLEAESLGTEITIQGEKEKNNLEILGIIRCMINCKLDKLNDDFRDDGE